MSENIIYIDPREVKFLVHRDREKTGFKLMKESIREVGVQQPLHVRKLTPAESRKTGSVWEAAFGEGRTRAMLELYRETRHERFLKLPAIEKDIPQGEVVGRFLSENILRRDHSWLEQAKLIKSEVGRAKGQKTAQVVSQLAKRLFITPGHAGKLVRILSQASPKIERELGKMTVAEAESLTSLPATGQEIVIETISEVGMRNAERGIEYMVKKAKDLAAEGQPLTKTALKQSVRRVKEDLEKLRPMLKLKRLHHSLGPENLRMLISDKTFRKAMDKEGINYSKFLEAT